MTVAKRLAGNPAVSVAVIEAGGSYETESGNVSEIPGYAARGTGDYFATRLPLVDWGIVIESQPVSNLTWPENVN